MVRVTRCVQHVPIKLCALQPPHEAVRNAPVPPPGELAAETPWVLKLLLMAAPERREGSRLLPLGRRTAGSVPWMGFSCSRSLRREERNLTFKRRKTHR